MSAQGFRCIGTTVRRCNDMGIQARTARMVASELQVLARLMDGTREEAARRVGSVTSRKKETIMRWAEHGVPSETARGTLFSAFQELEEHLRLVDQMTGDNLRRLRLEAGYTPEHLAAIVGVQPETYARWEGGTHTPQTESLKRLRMVLVERETPDTVHLSAAEIRWARQKMGWTQAQLADALGSSRSCVSNWESSQDTIPSRYASRILALMDAPAVTS